MANLTIKGIPQPVLDALRRRATTDRRSLNSEAIVAIETFIGRVQVDPEEFLEEVEQMHAEIGCVNHMTPEEIEDAIEAGRP